MKLWYRIMGPHEYGDRSATFEFRGNGKIFRLCEIRNIAENLDGRASMGGWVGPCLHLYQPLREPNLRMGRCEPRNEQAIVYMPLTHVLITTHESLILKSLCSSLPRHTPVYASGSIDHVHYLERRS
jgi:hypothetical protein